MKKSKRDFNAYGRGCVQGHEAAEALRANPFYGEGILGRAIIDLAERLKAAASSEEESAIRGEIVGLATWFENPSLVEKCRVAVERRNCRRGAPRLSLVADPCLQHKDSIKRSRAVPRLPRQLSVALNGLECGSVETVAVCGSVDGQAFTVIVGEAREYLAGLYKPMVKAPPPLATGNVVSIQREPSPLEQVIATGEAFQAGKISKLLLSIRHASGKVESKTIE